MDSLLSECLDTVGKPVEGNDVHPEERSNRDHLVEGSPEEEIAKIHFPCVL